MIKLGFKVLYRDEEGGLFSMVGGKNETRKTILPYKKNKWTFPNAGEGPLTVLNSRRAARFLKKNISYGEKLVIRRCLYEESRENYVWCKEVKEMHIDELEAMNQRILLCNSTRLADRVLIIE